MVSPLEVLALYCRAHSKVVTVKMHIQPSLVSDLALPAFTMSFKASCP